MISEDHVLVKTGVIGAENTALHHINKLHFKIQWWCHTGVTQGSQERGTRRRGTSLNTL